MRLSTCIAAEVTVGAVLLTAVTGGAVWGVGQVRSGAEEQGAPDPVAAAIVDQPAAGKAIDGQRSEGLRGGSAVPGAPGAPGEPPAPSGTFAGKPDAELLAPLRDSAIAKVKIGSCCTSLNMRIDFESGARAAFKPEQHNSGSMPRKEIAAYRMDRLLRIGAVPPSIGRRFRVEDISAKISDGGPRDRSRLMTEMISRDGEVDGELTWWIPDLSKPKIDGMLIDTADGVAAWQDYLTIGSDMPDDLRVMLAHISKVVLFDFLINNIDRWSGGNVLASPDGALLYFMDNTMAFRPQARGHSKVRAYLRRCQKFSRSLVATLRGLRVEDVRDAVAGDRGPFADLLTQAEIDAVVARRDAALRYVDDLIAREGEDAVLVFP